MQNVHEVKNKLELMEYQALTGGLVDSAEALHDAQKWIDHFRVKLAMAGIAPEDDDNGIS